MTKLFMPDAEEIKILIILAKVSPQSALDFLSLIQDEILNKIAEESADE